MYTLIINKNADSTKILLTKIMLPDVPVPVNRNWGILKSLLYIRPRLHELGTKSNWDHFVSVIVLFIVEISVRPGRK